MQYQAEQSPVSAFSLLQPDHVLITSFGGCFVFWTAVIHATPPAFPFLASIQAKERARLKRLRALTRTTDLIKRLQDAPGSLEELSQADAQHWTEQLEALEPSVGQPCCLMNTPTHAFAFFSHAPSHSHTRLSCRAVMRPVQLQEEGRRQHVVHMRSIYTPLSQQLTELQKESTAIAEYYSQDLYMHESENVYLSSFGILPEAPDHSERRS